MSFLPAITIDPLDGDALSSVRQLVDAEGLVTLVKEYQPYGEMLDSAGSGVSSYSFTGEATDASGLMYLRARYYAPQQGRFITRDSYKGSIDSPNTLNLYSYGFNNPSRYTDPSGQNPIVDCGLLILLALAEPTPIGEPAAFAGCLALLTGTAAVSYIAVQHAGELGDAVENLADRCDYSWLFLAPAPPKQQRGVRVDPFSLPFMWPAPTTQPKPKPQHGPEPIFPPIPTTTPEPKHIFYYSELGEYNPGRDTIQILEELDVISYIDGIVGLMNQLEAATYYPFIMGWKFQSERALYYYTQGDLQRVNSTSPLYDLEVNNMGSIRFIETKWSAGAIGRSTLEGVVRQARLHLTMTFLLETTWILNEDKTYLNREGGKEYP